MGPKKKKKIGGTEQVTNVEKKKRDKIYYNQKVKPMVACKIVSRAIHMAKIIGFNFMKFLTLVEWKQDYR
jgi:hypothetical protein